MGTVKDTFVHGFSCFVLLVVAKKLCSHLHLTFFKNADRSVSIQQLFISDCVGLYNIHLTHTHKNKYVHVCVCNGRVRIRRLL